MAAMEPLPSYEPDTYEERRASRRVHVTCSAVLQTMTTQTKGSLGDISDAGARFEADDPPSTGATALLRWNGHEAVCVIVWSEGKACGLSFKQPLAAEIVAETAALNKVLELPIASVGKIAQGQRRSASFLKAAPIEPSAEEGEAGPLPPLQSLLPASGPNASLAEVLARFRRTGTWNR